METRFFRNLTSSEWGEYWNYQSKRFSELGDKITVVSNGRTKVRQEAKDRIWEEFIQILEKRDEAKKGRKPTKPKALSSWD